MQSRAPGLNMVVLFDLSLSPRGRKRLRALADAFCGTGGGGSRQFL